MEVREYKDRVIALFRSGRATEDQWEEMATAVRNLSEDYDGASAVDKTVGFPAEDVLEARK